MVGTTLSPIFPFLSPFFFWTACFCAQPFFFFLTIPVGCHLSTILLGIFHYFLFLLGIHFARFPSHAPNASQLRPHLPPHLSQCCSGPFFVFQRPFLPHSKTPIHFWTLVYPHFKLRFPFSFYAFFVRSRCIFCCFRLGFIPPRWQAILTPCSSNRDCPSFVPFPALSLTMTMLIWSPFFMSRYARG